MKHLKHFLLIFILFFAGCVSVSWKDPNTGEQFVYQRPIFVSQNISRLVVTKDPNGIIFDLSGQKSESEKLTDMINALIAGGVLTVGAAK